MVVTRVATEEIHTVATCDVCGVPARQHYNEDGTPTQRLCTTHAGPAGYCRLCHRFYNLTTEPYVCDTCQAQLFCPPARRAGDIMSPPLTKKDHAIIAKQRATLKERERDDYTVVQV